MDLTQIGSLATSPPFLKYQTIPAIPGIVDNPHYYAAWRRLLGHDKWGWPNVWQKIGPKVGQTAATSLSGGRNISGAPRRYRLGIAVQDHRAERRIRVANSAGC